MNRGRALGPGQLVKRGEQWHLHYTEADGTRRRRALGTDKRVAERRRQELINQRNMELDGLGSVEGQMRTLAEIQADYVADLRLRVTPRHYAGVEARLGKVIERLGEVRVRDLRAMDVIRLRNELKAADASNRTCDTYTHSLKAMLAWAVAAALVHESNRTNRSPTPVVQATIATDAGRPSSNIRFKTLQAINASASCAFECRARSRPPMINLYRKKAFSTVPWRW